MNSLGPIIRPGAVTPAAAPGREAAHATAGGESFADLLSGLVDQVNDLQTTAGGLRDQMITGEAGDLHSIMIASEEAGIAMELLIEVRNKLVEAYQELLRMPV